MSLKANQDDIPPKEPPEEVEQFAVFRFPHSLGKRIKNQIKSLGCNWNSMLHGWLCPLFKQKDVEKTIQEAKLNFDIQISKLPKGLIPSDPKIAGRQSQLEILEETSHKDYMQLLKEIYSYDASLRPEDFIEQPTEEYKNQMQISLEKDFHDRMVVLQKNKESIKQIREELSHLNSDLGEKTFDPRAPLLISDALIKEHFLFKKHRTLQYCSDTFWQWDGIKYFEVHENEMRQIVYTFLRDAKKLNDAGHLEHFNPNIVKVNQIIDALRAICHQNYCPSSGANWIDQRKDPNPKHLISFRNGLLNVKNILENPILELIPHTPVLLNVNSLNFDFNPNAPEPQEWLKFLTDIWPKDLESQQALQEWTGYLLTQDTRLHKILLIVGPPRSGKGTIGRILHELLGTFNVAGPTLSSLGGEFGLQPLLNKMLATISDARLNGRGNNSLIIERLLSISGEDPLTINRKFLPPLTVQLPTRIMMMSNELPDMRDASGALANRYIVLTLQKSWLGKEDSFLFNRLCTELPGLLLWALKGLAQLQERGKFLQPASSAQTIEELEAMTSPIKAFISEMCKLNPLATVSITDLFDSWKNWSNFTGYPNAGNKQSFGKNLRAAVPEIEITRPQENFTRERCYKGISLIATQNQNSSADIRGQLWESEC